VPTVLIPYLSSVLVDRIAELSCCCSSLLSDCVERDRRLGILVLDLPAFDGVKLTTFLYPLVYFFGCHASEVHLAATSGDLYLS
jgi:hypothetical protein